MIRKAGWLIGGLVLLTAGCGAAETTFEPNVFSEKDMCAVKAEDSKAQVCYGASREAAEQVVGKATEEGDSGNFSYEGGVQLFYREDEVAAIRLLEESKGQYRTARGAAVGMSQEEIVKLYGDQDMELPGSGFLDYFYDSENKKLLTDPMKDLPPGSPEDAEKIHLVSTKLDADEHAEYILIMDRRWAMYMD
ncbi:hypothetical protein [Saccharibacillus sacchari]|uniref:Uncharacterized protein n=1 Tax=Saccharibacillus sacchari TaxID=456493 RepID=A0ACC6P802_9BACL